jgi:hypothetical protein
MEVSDGLRRTVVVAIVVVTAAAALLVNFAITRWRDAEDASVCHAEYSRARTASDSGVVDRMIPQRARGRGELAMPLPTCSDLRRAGRLR